MILRYVCIRCNKYFNHSGNCKFCTRELVLRKSRRKTKRDKRVEKRQRKQQRKSEWLRLIDYPVEEPKKKREHKPESKKQSLKRQKRMVCKYGSLKDAYQKYLLSPHWKMLRSKKLKINKLCEKCDSDKKINIHHLRYRTWFNVKIEDLMTLCESCHKKEHGL